MRKCKKCYSEKSIENFRIVNNTNLYRSKVCKDCEVMHGQERKTSVAKHSSGAVIYILAIKADDIKCFKIGSTTNDVKVRAYRIEQGLKHLFNDVLVQVVAKFYVEEKELVIIEYDIHENLSKIEGVSRVKFLSHGSTEMFCCDYNTAINETFKIVSKNTSKYFS